MIEPIQRTVEVPLPASQAYEIFTDELASWWPPEYTWGKDVREDIGIEPRVGGRCYEIGPHGFHSDWGRVLVWEPPRRLVLAWQISAERVPEPDPAKASEVEVRFVADGPSATRVEFEHHSIGRHGESGEMYRTGLDSPQGWTYILDCYVADAIRGRDDGGRQA